MPGCGRADRGALCASIPWPLRRTCLELWPLLRPLLSADGDAQLGYVVLQLSHSLLLRSHLLQFLTPSLQLLTVECLRLFQLLSRPPFTLSRFLLLHPVFPDPKLVHLLELQHFYQKYSLFFCILKEVANVCPLLHIVCDGYIFDASLPTLQTLTTATLHFARQA